MNEIERAIEGLEYLLGADGKPLITLDRLRELVEADRDGRRVVLPCKVGDTVYEITQDYYAVVDCPYVDSVYVDEIAYTVWDEDDEVQIKINGYLDIEDVYFTRAEAEAALEGRE